MPDARKSQQPRQTRAAMTNEAVIKPDVTSLNTQTGEQWENT
jgi:hypothetical protein